MANQHRPVHWLILGIGLAGLLVRGGVAAEQSHDHDHKHQQHGTAGLPQVPPPDPSATQVPEGYRVEVAMEDLTYPTSVEFDDQGTMHIAEAGYSYGDEQAKPRILAVSPSGEVREVTTQLEGPVNDLLWHDGRMFISHRGKISVLEGENVRDLVTGLPSLGDHHNNQLTAGPDGKIYFGQGTATNSAVVGIDNYQMGWLKDHPDFHDVSAEDLQLVERVFTTKNPLKEGEQKARTSAFHPFNQTAEDGIVKGQVKANGTILRMNPDGSDLEVYAWGLRNPYGVIWGPDGKLYATENGYDVRGSRPIANDREDLYLIKQGAWYGWPDFAFGVPVTDERFAPEEGSKPQFLMKEHPPVEEPILTFPQHASIAKADFAPGGEFGHKGKLFVAFFGHMTPMTGEVEQHGGHRVVAIDLATKKVETFFTKKHGHHDQGKAKTAQHGDHHGGKKSKTPEHGKDRGHHGESTSAGPRRLLDVRFSPKGDALYVADFGSMIVTEKAVKPIPRTGVVWRIVPADSAASGSSPQTTR